MKTGIIASLARTTCRREPIENSLNTVGDRDENLSEAIVYKEDDEAGRSWRSLSLESMACFFCYSSDDINSSKQVLAYCK